MIDKFKYFVRTALTKRAAIMADNLDTGRRTVLNVGSEVRGDVSIGNYCAIGRNVTFQGRNHDTTRPGVQDILYRDVLKTPPSEDIGPIRIGNDVWIGNNVTILPNVTVGDGAVIGAGAVVANDVTPFEIVGGVPAAHLKWRFPKHIRDQLLEIEWWNWDESRIKANKEFFELKLSEIKASEDLRQYILK